MGRELCAHSPAAAALFAQADTILNRPLTRLAFEGPLDELTLTANCQPALFVHGLATLAALRAGIGDFPITAAGGPVARVNSRPHAAAGTFDFATGLKLVEARGRFMEEACLETNGAMAAVIGAEENVVRGLAADTDVDIANLNCPGQIVISGEAERIALAASMAREVGIRKVAMLNVAEGLPLPADGARLCQIGQRTSSTTVLQQPTFAVVSNVDARSVGDFDDIRHTLTEQVTGTVCWAQSVEYMLDTPGLYAAARTRPGQQACRMVNRIRKGTEIISVVDPTSLATAVERLRRA